MTQPKYCYRQNVRILGTCKTGRVLENRYDMGWTYLVHLEVEAYRFGNVCEWHGEERLQPLSLVEHVECL